MSLAPQHDIEEHLKVFQEGCWEEVEAQGGCSLLFHLSLWVFSITYTYGYLFFKWHSVKDISVPSNLGVSTSLPLKSLQGPSSVCPSRGDQRMHTEKYTNKNVKLLLMDQWEGPPLLFFTHLVFCLEQQSLKIFSISPAEAWEKHQTNPSGGASCKIPDWGFCKPPSSSNTRTAWESITVEKGSKEKWGLNATCCAERDPGEKRAIRKQWQNLNKGRTLVNNNVSI